MHGKTLIIAAVALLIGLGTGFLLRPVIVSAPQMAAITSPAPVTPAAPRGTQYFAVHLDEARQITALCAKGSVRGDECSNAEQAVIEAEGRDRFKRFMGN